MAKAEMPTEDGRRRTARWLAAGTAACLIAMAAAAAWLVQPRPGDPGGGCLPGLECHGDAICRFGACLDPRTIRASYFYSPQYLADSAAIRALIVEALALYPGMAVADIGAGNGNAAAAMAAQVGEQGRVFATELDAAVASGLRDRFSAAATPQVHVRLARDAHDTALDDLASGSLDRIILINSVQFGRRWWSDADDVAYLARLRQLLKPDGWLVLHNDWIGEHDLDRAGVESLAARAGLQVPGRELPMPGHIPAAEARYHPGWWGLTEMPLARGFIAVWRPASR